MRRPYVVQLRLTQDEHELLDRLAKGQRISIEELVRDHLGFRTVLTPRSPSPPERHLRVIQPEPAL